MKCDSCNRCVQLCKKNFKNAIGVDTFHFANKTDFAY